MLPVVTTTIPTTTTGKLFDPEVESWRDLVSVYFKSGDVERVLELIHCESSGNMYAQNPKKTLYGYAQGLLQHMTSLFPTRALEAKSAGYNNNGDVWNPADNLSVGAWLLYETRQGWNHWTCTKLLK
jgi:soluble lytic murein transglycosylase-like protein